MEDVLSRAVVAEEKARMALAEAEALRLLLGEAREEIGSLHDQLAAVRRVNDETAASLREARALLQAGLSTLTPPP